MSGVRGVLRTPPDDAWSLDRFDPGPQLAPSAVWHWIVTWDLRGREPHHQATLPHPAPHVVVEEGGAWLYGPLTERFERTLAGVGRAVGLRFRPGAIRPLLNAPVSSLRRPSSRTVRCDCSRPTATSRAWGSWRNAST
jgi:hypothetical protein